MSISESRLNILGRNIATNVSRLVEANGLPNKELAERVGLSTSTIYRINKARAARRPYRPMLSTVIKLAADAGVSVDDFIRTRLVFE